MTSCLVGTIEKANIKKKTPKTNKKPHQKHNRKDASLPFIPSHQNLTEYRKCLLKKYNIYSLKETALKYHSGKSHDMSTSQACSYFLEGWVFLLLV